MSDGSNANKTLEQLGGISPTVLIWIFFAGFISAMAMMIPGISGSIVMLMLGAYTVSVEAVSTFNIPIVLVVGLGIILGSLSGIRLIRTILTLHPQIVYCAVLGLITGSIFIIYPGFSRDAEGAIALLFAFLFIVITGIFSKRK
jgi:putative membrane protein